MNPRLHSRGRFPAQTRATSKRDDRGRSSDTHARVDTHTCARTLAAGPKGDATGEEQCREPRVDRRVFASFPTFSSRAPGLVILVSLLVVIVVPDRRRYALLGSRLRAVVVTHVRTVHSRDFAKVDQPNLTIFCFFFVFDNFTIFQFLSIQPFLILVNSAIF